MKVLTDAEISMIIIKAESAWSVNKIPVKYKQNFITTLESFIRKGGLVENICPQCLGTGRKEV